MPSWAQSGLPLVAFLLFVVFFRAQGTYWLARAIPEALTRWGGRVPSLRSLAKWVDGPVPKRGARILERRGIIAIPLCFLTVGLQTAVLAGSGLVRMNWAKFTAAMIPGCIAWAFLYGYGLLAVWTTAVKAVAGNVWAWAALIVVIGTLIVYKQRGRIASAAVSVVGASK